MCNVDIRDKTGNLQTFGLLLRIHGEACFVDLLRYLVVCCSILSIRLVQEQVQVQVYGAGAWFR